jgi:hypothetical protein
MSSKVLSALASIILCVGFAAPVEGALMTFNSRSIFNTVAPGLSVDTFETGLVAPGGVTVCTGPLSSAAASACFPLGGLLPGAVYSAMPGPSMVVLGAGFPGVGNTSKVVGPNAFSDTFNVNYSNANAVGFDVLPGAPGAAPVLISVFSPLSILLGSFNIPGPIGGTFWGVVSDTDLIGRINIQSLPNGGELIDNHAFGIAQIPEPTVLALLGVGTLSLGLLRRRSRKSA